MKFCKKGVLRNFAKFTGKPLCQSVFEFCKVFKNTYFYRTPLVAASIMCKICSESMIELKEDQ